MTGNAPRWLGYKWVLRSLRGSLLVACIVLLLGVLTAASRSTVLSIVVGLMLIMIVVTLGLQIFTGNSGIISYGHIGFMAIGAYVSALLTIPSAIKGPFLPGLPPMIASSELAFIPAMLIALLVVGLLALLTGVPLVRMSNIAAGAPIITFAFLVVVEVVLGGWQGVTGGRRALYGVPTFATIPWITGIAIVALLGARLFRDSPVGLKLRASREDEVAAKAMGVNLRTVRLGTWVVSAAFCAMGGVLLGHFIGVFSPSQFWLATTVNVLAMLIVGGMTTTSGAVIGVVLITLVLEVMRFVEVSLGNAPGLPDVFGLAQITVAIVFLVVLYARPGGLTGRWEIDEHLAAWRRTRRAEKPDREPSSPAVRSL
jgi:branched-chain amino acid transport system permease protein